MSKVLIRIKSYKEIEKTLDANGYHESGAYFNPYMMRLCEEGLEADSTKFNSCYAYHANTWEWHPDWVEVISETEQEESEMLEMLDYFLSLRGGK